MNPTITKTKVAVAMSGGVDSSTTAYLLKEQGYDVIGVTAWLLNGKGKCCSDALVNAAKVCEQIGIEYDVLDIRQLFEKEIINYFNKSYSEGLTPSPCIVCNGTIKWGALLDYVRDKHQAEYIATGHYAKIDHLPDGTVKLSRPKDRRKDQTYMLFNLTQQQLQQTMFPLADYVKAETIETAQDASLHNAHIKESQDICFVNGKMADYFNQHFQPDPGSILDEKTGNKIGEHSGAYQFTIGQRKGVNVAAQVPIYVSHVDTEKNIVYTNTKDAIYSTRLKAENTNWISGITPNHEFDGMVKIRYNSPSTLAKVIPLENNQFEVFFNEPQFAITPGQAVVIYDTQDEYVLGGGWIVPHRISG